MGVFDEGVDLPAALPQYPGKSLRRLRGYLGHRNLLLAQRLVEAVPVGALVFELRLVQAQTSAHHDRVTVQQLRAFGPGRVPPHNLHLFFLGYVDAAVPFHHRLAGQPHPRVDLLSGQRPFTGLPALGGRIDGNLALVAQPPPSAGKIDQQPLAYQEVAELRALLHMDDHPAGKYRYLLHGCGL